MPGKKTSVYLADDLAAAVAACPLSLSALIRLGLACHAGMHADAEALRSALGAAITAGESAAASWSALLAAARSERDSARAELSGAHDATAARIRAAVAAGMADALGGE